MGVEPLPDEPAAIASTNGQRLLVLADYHAGIEAGLRREGVELESGARERRRHVERLVAETAVDRLLVLGDLGHSIGESLRDERAEIEALLETVSVPVTITKGNHDAEIEAVLEGYPEVTLAAARGVRIGDVGFVHGHTWPRPEVLAADVVCMGHEHPVVRLEDHVGGRRKERVWLRGSLDATPFVDQYGSDVEPIDADVIVCPAFNDRSGGTWVNVSGQAFLSPFLPAGLDGAEAYLLDGTRLGDFARV
jgi:hypothetical protein